MPIGPISVNEFKKAFFSNKTNKRPGDNEMNFILNGMILIKSCFAKLCESLQYLFNVSFEKSIFPDSLKIAKVTPIFKVGDNTELSNYRPICVPPCFSKILDRVSPKHIDQKILLKKIRNI